MRSRRPREEDQADKPRRGSGEGLNVPWSGLSIALAIVALASLGTLAVTTSVKNVDTLSTVALALAVLAFAAQLIVTMAQGHQSAQVNADTEAALTEMRATTSSLLTNQRDQFNSVLKALLRQAIPAAVQDVAAIEEGSEIEPGARIKEDAERAAELESALQKRVLELFTADTDVMRPIIHSESHERLMRKEDAAQDEQLEHQKLRIENAEREKEERIRKARRKRRTEWSERLSTYPSEEVAEPVASIIRQLPPRAIAQLSRFVGDVRDAAKEDETVTYRKADETPHGKGNQQLIDAGLVEVVKELPFTVNLRLTADGLIAARLLRADQESPEWLAGLF